MTEDATVMTKISPLPFAETVSRFSDILDA